MARHSTIAIILQCALIFTLSDMFRLQTSSKGTPLNNWISTASDIESQMDDQASQLLGADFLSEGLCGMDGRLSASALSLELQPHNMDWGSAKCGTLSQTKFIGKTRTEAQMICKAQLGTPDLTVDDKQTCACCPIKCTPAMASEVPGHNRTDPELSNMLLDDANAQCLSPFPREVDHDHINWLTSLQLTTDRQCSCHCTVKPVSPFKSTLVYDQQRRCIGYNSSHKFTNCNECICAGSGVSMTAKKDSCEKDGGVFRPEDCSCRCKNDPDMDLDEAKANATNSGHTFDPGCCCSRCGSVTGAKVSEAEANCTSVDMHTFDKSNGQCKCKCKYGAYAGKTLADAKKQCTAVDGGASDPAEMCRCNCQYESETVQVEQARQNCAQKVPTQADSNGVFTVSKGKCKCACGTGSEPGASGKEVTARSNICPAPQKFEIKDTACKCFCSDNSHQNQQGKLVQQSSHTCTAKKGTFVPKNCTCYQKACTPGKELEQPCCANGTTPAKDADTCHDECASHCEDEATKTNCAKLDTSSADWKCLCPGSTSKHFFFERHQCKAHCGKFTLRGGNCGCDCGKNDPKTGLPRRWDENKAQCKKDGGVFENCTCDCVCTNHTGLYHGAVTIDGISLVSTAKAACKGKHSASNGACHCAPLESEPCCNDGSGMLISQKKKWCSEQEPKGQWRLQGEEADCACVPPDETQTTLSPAANVAPPAPAPAFASSTSQYFWAVVGDPSWEEHASGSKKPECLISTDTQSHQKNEEGEGLGVTCCTADGNAFRPSICPDHDLSYSEAAYICAESSSTLCDKEQISKGLGKGTGCNYDANLVWTKTACTEEEAKKSSAITAPQPAPAPAPAADGAPAPAPEQAPAPAPEQAPPEQAPAEGADLQQKVGPRPRIAGFELWSGHAIQDNNAACNNDEATSKGKPFRYYYASNAMECADTCNSCASCKAFVDNHKKSPKYCVFKMSSQSYQKNDPNNEKDTYIKASTTTDLELGEAANELEQLVEE